MSNRLVVGIDLDSTMNNLLHHWVKIYNRVWNDNLKEEDITTWDLDRFVKPECGKKVYKLLNTPNLFRLLDARKGVIESLKKLVDAGFDTYIITAYNYKTVFDKVMWVKEKAPFYDKDKIMFVNNKKLVKLDVLIDDGLHNFSKTNHGVAIPVACCHNKLGMGKFKEEFNCGMVLNDWEAEGDELIGLLKDLADLKGEMIEEV